MVKSLPTQQAASEVDRFAVPHLELIPLVVKPLTSAIPGSVM